MYDYAESQSLYIYIDTFLHVLPFLKACVAKDRYIYTYIYL